MHGLPLMLMLAAAAGSAESGGRSLADPTRPADVAESGFVAPLPEGLMDWRLTAVRIGRESRTAVLNGAIVRTGDLVGQARVLEIRPGSVIVELGHRQLEVRLYDGGITKTKSKQATNPEPK